MTTGPGSPKSLGKAAKSTTVEVIQLEILTCSTCGQDSLFARVQEAGTGKLYHFCSRCGEYFEIVG